MNQLPANLPTQCSESPFSLKKPRNIIQQCLIVAALFVGSALSPTAQAATYWWDTATTSNWATGTNWSDNFYSGGITGIVPNSSTTDTAIFNQAGLTAAATAAQIAANTTTQTVGGIVFNNTSTNAINTASATNGFSTGLNLGSGGIFINNGAGAVTLGNTTAASNIYESLSASQSWVNNSTNALTVNGVITAPTASNFTLTFGGSGGAIINNTATVGSGAINNPNTSGTLSVLKTGSGSLIFNDAVTTTAIYGFSGGLTVNAGTLQINNTSTGGVAVTDPIKNTNSLTLGGGAFWQYVSAGSGHNVDQTLAGLSLNAGASTIMASSGFGSGFHSYITVGTVTRSVGSTLNVTTAAPNSNGARVIMAGTSNAVVLDNGVAYATDNFNTTFTTLAATGDNWAAFSTTAVSGSNFLVTSVGDTTNFPTTAVYTTVAAAGTLAASTNADVTGSPAATNSVALTTLRMSGATVKTITINGGQTLTTGGILITSNVAGNTQTITGGTLRSAASVANKDLVIFTNQSGANYLDLTGTVVDNALAGATGLTKSGTGGLWLGATNKYSGPTYINGGYIQIASDSTGTTNPLGAYPSLTPNAITLNGGILANTGLTTIIAVNRGITLGGNGGTFVTANNTSLTLNGIITSATGASTANSYGALQFGNSSNLGTVVLGGNNTFVGGVQINNGELQLAAPNPGALNSTAGSENTLVMNQASSVGLNGATTGAGSLFTLNGNSITIGDLKGTGTAGAFPAVVQNANASNSTLTVGNSQNLQAGSNFNGLIQDGTVGGTLGLVKTGTGTLTLAPSIIRASTSGTLGAFVIGVADTSFLQVGTAVSGTGVGTNTTIQSIVPNTSITVSVANSGTVSGNLTFSQRLNTYTGGTFIKNGLLSAGSGVLPTATSLTLGDSVTNSGGVLLLTGNNNTISSLATAGSAGLNNLVTVNSGVTLTDTGGTAQTFNGTIGGAGNFTYSGANTLSLGGRLSLTGATTIGSGSTIKLTDANVLGTSGAATTTFKNQNVTGTLTLQYAAGATLNATSVVDLSVNTSNVSTLALSLDGNNQTFASLNLGQKNTMNVTSTSGTPTLTVTGSTLIGSTNSANVNQTIAPASGASVILGAVTGITPTGGSARTNTLTLDGTTTGNQINNAITDVSGTVLATTAITKSNTSTWTLSSGTNTYTGATNVSGGTLIVNGSIANSISVSVAKGAQLRGLNGTVSAISTASTGSGNPVIWPGIQTVVSGLTSGDEKLTAASADLTTNGGKLNIVFNNSTGKKQQLELTGTSATTLKIDNTSVLSLAFDTNLGSGVVIVNLTGVGASISQPFLETNVKAGSNTYGVHYHVTYKSVNGTASDSVDPTGGSFISGSNSGSTGPYNQIVIQLANGVTPVKISDFAAKSEGSGVNVSWKAVSEYKNAGFNVYRRSSDGGEWTLVNPALIAGRVTNPDEKMYSFFDWASSGEWQYKLESIDIAGGKETYEQFAGPVSLDWNSDLTVASDVDSGSVATVQDGFAVMAGVRNAQAVSATIASMKQDAVELNNVAVREVTAIATSAKTNVAARSVASNALSLSVSNIGVRWFSTGKVGASSSSVAKVVYSTPGVMVIPQNSMPNGYDLNNVTLQREGRNMSALAKVPAGLLVYAPGYADDYTDKDAVFIRKSTAATNVVSAPTSTGLFNSSAPVNVTSPATVTNDYHDVYFDYSTVYRPFSFAPWFSSKYLTQGTTQDFTVTLPQASSGPATLTLNLWSLTSDASVNPDHALQLVVNGTVVSDASWDGGDKMMQLSFTIPSGVLNSGDNTVSLVTPTLSGVSSQVCFVHSISADYTRLLDGSKSFEIVNNSGNAQLYELNNVPSTGAWVVDTRFSDRASLVASETSLQADGTLRLRFMASSGGSGKFVVTPVGQENAPISITSRLVKAAKLTGTYLATGPLQFSSGVQPLLMKRSKEGIRGTYFDQEALFDYYNYGRYGPDAIRNAVRSLKPKYLLLVGRTTYDYRNYEGKNIDPLCPAYLVSTSFWAQTTSDSLFGDLGRGYPEVAVGRLPVNNTTELSGAISHILSYTGIPQSGLRLHAVADQADPLSADFGAQLDAMVKANNPDVTWQENYLLRTYQSAPEVTDALKTAANGGADLILYSGHGNAARLGNTTTILDATLVQQWTGNTVFLQSTCTANWMAKNVDDYKSIAIQAMTQAQGGISASVGTSTYMNPDVATAFMNQLIKNTNQGNARWGNVLLSTQQWAGRQTGSGFYTDLMNTEQLFGDPAMPVFAPKSINTAPSNSGAGTPVGTF